MCTDCKSDKINIKQNAYAFASYTQKMGENGKVGLRYSVGGGKHGLNEKEFSNVAEEKVKVLRKISYAMLDFNNLEIAKIK